MAGDVIVCFLQGFLQKFCIGRGNVIFLHRAAENKTIGGALQLGFRIDGLFGGTLQLVIRIVTALLQYTYTG